MVNSEIPADPLASKARHGFAENMAFLLVLITLTLVPFVYHPETLDAGIHLRFTVWAALLAITSFFVALKHVTRVGQVFPVRNAIFLSGILFVVAAWLSGVDAANPEDWLYASLRSTLFVIQFAVFVAVLDHRRLHVIVFVIAAAGSAAAVIGLLQAWFGILTLGRLLEPPYATMMHPNLFAHFLFLTLPLTLYGLWKLPRWRIFFAIAAALMITGILVAGTRASIAAIMIGGAITLLVVLWADHRTLTQRLQRIRLGGLYASAVFLLVLAIVFMFVITDQLTDIDQRLKIWQATLDLAFDHPLAGVGSGNWVQYTSLENLRLEITRANWVRPHNDFLWVLSETGPLGLIAYAGMFIASFVVLMKALNRQSSAETCVLAAITLFGLIGYLLIANVSFPRERIEHTVLLALYLSLAVIVGRRNVPQSSNVSTDAERGGSYLYTSLFFIAALVAGFAVIVGVYRTRGEIHIARVHAAMQTQAWRAVVREARMAENPFYSAHPNGLPLTYLQGAALFEMKQYTRGIDLLEQAYTEHPQHVLIAWYLGRAYLSNQQPDPAIEMFERVRQWWPNSALTLPSLAMAYYMKDDYETAYRYLAKYQSMPMAENNPHEQLWEALRRKLGSRADTLRPME